MFKHRSDKKELMDDLALSDDELKKNLDELEIYNQWLGGRKVLIAALNQIHEKYSSDFTHKIIIADLGCGSGDLLRVMDDWAKEKKLVIELVGIDANPFMIDYAASKSHDYPHIKFKAINVFSPEFKQMRFDIVSINSVCHHFTDGALVELFKQLATQTRLAIIINDLHRHWLSYFTIKVLTKIINFSYLAKHDAPLSVLRAFRKHELTDILERADLTTYQVRWAWPFRWKVIIWPVY